MIGGQNVINRRPVYDVLSLNDYPRVKPNETIVLLGCYYIYHKYTSVSALCEITVMPMSANEE